MKIKVFLLLISVFSILKTEAQVYNLQSLDGKKTPIKFYYKPSSGILKISTLKDSFSISNFMSVDTVMVLNNIFLKISYAKRAGSNQDMMNELWLYVENFKLKQIIHINTLEVYDFRPLEYKNFRVNTTLEGDNFDNYQLEVSIHDEKKDAHENYSWDKTEVLKFDRNKKIFFNSIEKISGVFQFYEKAKKGSSKKIFKGSAPVIKIKSNKYYFINGVWYLKEKDRFYSMSL